MIKRIIFGLLLVAFGLFYNAYRSELKIPKQPKKVMLIEHRYDKEILWVDNKYYEEIIDSIHIIKNAPKGYYELVDFKFVIDKDSTDVIIKKVK